MNHKEKARALFLSGCNCAQAVFAAFSDVTGIEDDKALLISSSFGGGMGHIGETCGAVTGMFMAVGMICGYTEGDADTKKAHYNKISELADEFKAEFEFLRCPDLMGNLDGGKYALPDEEVYKNRPCLIFVEKGVELVEKILKEGNKNGN